MDACLSLNPLLTVVYLNTHLKTAVQRRTAEKTLCADYKVSQYKYQIPFIMKFKKLGEANPENDFALKVALGVCFVLKRRLTSFHIFYYLM